MILSEYIKCLEEIFKNNGELEVVYSSDEEGNYFGKVGFNPSVGHFNDQDREWYDENYMIERNDEIEINNELHDEHEELLHFNAICIN